MPFGARLIAIDRAFGKYSVHSQFDDFTDGPLRGSDRIADVSTNPGYQDFAGILSREEIKKNTEDKNLLAWLNNLPPHIGIIMVVHEEW